MDLPIGYIIMGFSLLFGTAYGVAMLAGIMADGLDTDD